jgi:hypothetical protein
MRACAALVGLSRHRPMATPTHVPGRLGGRFSAEEAARAVIRRDADPAGLAHVDYQHPAGPPPGTATESLRAPKCMTESASEMAYLRSRQ